MKCWQCGEETEKVDYDRNRHGWQFEDYQCDDCDLRFAYEFGPEWWDAFVYDGDKEDFSQWREVVDGMPYFDGDAIERRRAELAAEWVASDRTPDPVFMTGPGTGAA